MHSKKNQSFSKRLSYALTGIHKSWKRNTSVRTQTLAVTVLLIFCVFMRPPLLWCALFAAMAAMVLALELVNSAVEAILDKLHPNLDSEIGFANDCLAGAVLVASVASVIVFGFYLIFATK